MIYYFCKFKQQGISESIATRVLRGAG